MKYLEAYQAERNIHHDILRSSSRIPHITVNARISGTRLCVSFNVFCSEIYPHVRSLKWLMHTVKLPNSVHLSRIFVNQSFNNNYTSPTRRIHLATRKSVQRWWYRENGIIPPWNFNVSKQRIIIRNYFSPRKSMLRKFRASESNTNY